MSKFEVNRFGVAQSDLALGQCVVLEWLDTEDEQAIIIGIEPSRKTSERSFEAMFLKNGRYIKYEASCGSSQVKKILGLAK
jgi:hypothetical protein